MRNQPLFDYGRVYILQNKLLIASVVPCQK
uniref:Uncharacterized protein n=1 Tax=Arundo donax TaxID=35708 RepID=A0A0A9BYQ3_ARUDO